MAFQPRQTRLGSSCPWHGEYCMYDPCPFLDALQLEEIKPCAYYGNEKYCQDYGAASPCCVDCPASSGGTSDSSKAGPSEGQQEQTQGHWSDTARSEQRKP